MRLKDQKEYLEKQNIVPSADLERRKWLGMDDALSFLLATREGVMPVYISCNGFFAYSVIVPEDKLHSDYVRDLLGWNFNHSSGYSYGYSYPEGKPQECLIDPMDWTGSEILNGSTPIFFLRHFAGHKPSTIIEINQQISHVLGIYWLDERKAYCRINELGEYTDIATVDQDEELILCTIKMEDLEFYLFLSHSVLVRVFGVNRSSIDWMKVLKIKNRKVTDYQNLGEETFATRTTAYNNKKKPTSAWFRGFQIIRNRTPREKMIRKLTGKQDRQYASFIILDWKNEKVHEWSSDPEKIGNYFVKSDLPFGTSPAFFKPEVLARYKQNPSKYVIEPRKIKCRGAWSLRYDINEEGQVHAYIYDLSHLPYTEQLYWKSFNEKPKGGISKSSFITDFLGKWDFRYDPLISLKQILDTFPIAKEGDKPLPIWQMPKSPETRDIKFLNYVVTDSVKEWEDQILALAQILVDGLVSRSINRLAEHLACRDKTLKSLKQMIKCLEILSIPKDDVSIIQRPLREVWDLRSSIVAHPGTGYPEGDLKIHYGNLVKSCDEAMRKLAEFIKQEILNIDQER